jgi:tripartite-type tricarboxylate transporter receptor subunit TctC
LSACATARRDFAHAVGPVVRRCTPYETLLPLALAAVLAAVPPAHGQDFYKGRTITITVGFSAGGGYDLNARTVGRHLGRHIPGNPNIVVKNMPGAGGATSVRFLDTTAPKDGTSITVFNPGLVTESIVEPEKINPDFRTVSWVGAVSSALDARVCYGFGTNGVRTWDELMHRKEFIVGGSAKGTGSYVNAATLRYVFNAPVRLILGFSGSSDYRLAIERGELDGDCGSFSSIPAAWITERKAHPFVRFSEQRPAEIPETAVFINDFVTSENQRQLLDMLNAADAIGHPFVMSKQVPAERLSIVRKAFDELMRDPAFLADMEKQQLSVIPMTGEGIERIVAKIMNASPAIIAKAKQIYD